MIGINWRSEKTAFMIKLPSLFNQNFLSLNLILMKRLSKPTTDIVRSLILIPGVVFILYACNSSSGNTGQPMPPPQLPVISVSTAPATTHQDYPASLEGKVNVEIRPQVEGYLEKIYVDEGAYVTRSVII